MHSPLDNHPAHWQDLLPRPHADSHKYSRGAVLIQGGYPVTGAARLAAIAAARMGAGITSITVPEQAFAIYSSQCLSIMVKPYADGSTQAALIAEPRIQAYLIGPGAGVSAATASTTLHMLQQGKPVVMDADAITSLAGQLEILQQHSQGRAVLTPHAGEFARLFGQPVATSLPERMQQASQAARDCNSTLLLKGAHTVIASPDGRLSINRHAPPTLATAGAGDVLAGMIVSLLAQGMQAFEACAAAAWIHGEAARLFGVGLMAEDLPGMIPTVLNGLMP